MKDDERLLREIDPGDRTVGHRTIRFYSRIEANMARHYESLKSQRFIKGWRYQADHFELKPSKWYHSTWLPDFTVEDAIGVVYVDIRHYMGHDIHRFNAVRREYPKLRLHAVLPHEYRLIEMKTCILDWEY